MERDLYLEITNSSQAKNKNINDLNFQNVLVAAYNVFC